MAGSLKKGLFKKNHAIKDLVSIQKLTYYTKYLEENYAAHAIKNALSVNALQSVDFLKYFKQWFKNSVTFDPEMTCILALQFKSKTKIG